MSLLNLEIKTLFHRMDCDDHEAVNTYCYKYNKKDLIPYFEQRLERNQSDTFAINCLGYIWANDDYNLSTAYYLRAIQLGDIYAMANMGLQLETKRKDYLGAKKLYQQSAELGNSYAMVLLANYYEYYEYNLSEAERWYVMGIELGCKEGINNLALIYQNRDKDFESALKLLQEAKLYYFHPTPLYNLAMIYKHRLNQPQLAVPLFLRGLEISYSRYKKCDVDCLRQYLKINQNPIVQYLQLKPYDWIPHVADYIKTIDMTDFLAMPRSKGPCELICHDNEEKILVQLTCGHKICEMCYAQWSRCPVRCI